MLPILAKYRRDLRILVLDCPPTGLVACTRLDPGSQSLAKSYYDILDEFAQLQIGSFRLHNPWSIFPLVSSHEIMRQDVITSMFTVS
jgi:hypothetical protein